jgi:hypothetical protein
VEGKECAAESLARLRENATHGSARFDDRSELNLFMRALRIRPILGRW